MPPWIAMPVLAAVDTGFIIFIVIMIISWLMKLFAKAKEKASQTPAPPQRSRRQNQKRNAAPEADQLQAEIDRFLKEVNKANSDVRDQPPARPVVAPPLAVEPPSRVAPPRGTNPIDLPAPLRPEPVGAGWGLSRAETERAPLESSIRARLEAGNQDRLQRQHYEDPRANVADSVRQHLGTFAGSSTAANTTASLSAAASIRKMFADRSSIRQAIVMNEILTRPKRFGSPVHTPRENS